MADNPLVHLARAAPVLVRANDLRRQIEGRIRSFDTLQWPAVPYGPDPAQRLHFWQLNDLGPRDGWPVVLLIHGGGWVEGSWQSFESLAPAFAHRGVMAVAMSYRLAPEHRWPAQLEDVVLALDFLRSQQIDADRIGLWGHSAGGHIALMGAAQGGVRAVVALGAPTDLRLLDAEGPDELSQVFDRSSFFDASPLHVASRLPRTLLVHGSEDAIVSVQHARSLAAASDEVELMEVAGGDHGLRWPLLAAPLARRKATGWLVDALEPASRGSKWRRRKKGKR